MKLNDHLNYEGRHAFLSPSKYHWINYTDEQLVDRYRGFMAVQRGTKLHEIARMLIEEGIRLPRTSQTLNRYVNDAIGFKMLPERPLVYSQNCFGTADAIKFYENKKLLRIHDLKTGSTPAHMEQLMIYAALFCLEYNINPADISIELRIYQNDDVEICEPTADDIFHIMDRIVTADECIESLKAEEQGNV